MFLLDCAQIQAPSPPSGDQALRQTAHPAVDTQKNEWASEPSFWSTGSRLLQAREQERERAISVKDREESWIIPCAYLLVGRRNFLINTNVLLVLVTLSVMDPV